MVAAKLALYEDNYVLARDRSGVELVKERIVSSSGIVPSRDEQVSKICGSRNDRPFDVLVIGGGATGAGAALDAASRGLRVALVERDDFSSGTSSRSTKLLHGGVRYLEKAVFNLDYGQLKLVFHALDERNRIIQNAPHICRVLPTMTPCFSWFEVVYYWAGLKAYDLVAGSGILQLSKYYSVRKATDMFPTLAKECDGRKLRGVVVYCDGQMDDSRLNIGLACTAALAGAVVLNHAEVVSLQKDAESGGVVGARVRDNLTGKEFDVHAKVLVNAAGPFCDSVRKMADAGTTDSNTTITPLPQPHDDEIEFILSAISGYLNVEVRGSDILSSWSGIRPLAIDPSVKDTASISRDHIVHVDCPGLVTISGGKWTTYRSMAEDVIDAAVKHGKLSPSHGSSTANLPITGAYGWEPSLFVKLAQSYARKKTTKDGRVETVAIDATMAKHLSTAYGSMAYKVASIAQEENLGNRLVRGHPYLEAEVAYCARNEYCETAVDFIGRRTRLAFLDAKAAALALPRVIQILAAERGWGAERCEQENQNAKAYLSTFRTSIADN
ncbi:hypothetical protein Scep_011278 [Stephania cephalantha]|uniref:Glycerol-3-phosphate dehydrogenase n=1 Tax=Stephania cephalantha TaxID=152367 RepID=A0AAP0JDV4_9MAGN